MTLFHDVSFPLPLALGAKGGPVRRTDITPLASGFEHRATPHAASKRRFDIGAGIQSVDDMDALIRFFEARMGQLYAFRFRDPMDYASCQPSQTPGLDDQVIGMGDGAQTTFQLKKTYGDDAGSYERFITKPVVGSVLIGADGQTQRPSINHETGGVTFSEPPPIGVQITAGFQFDVPVRFDAAQLDLTLNGFGPGTAPSILLVEVLNHA